MNNDSKKLCKHHNVPQRLYIVKNRHGHLEFYAAILDTKMSKREPKLVCGFFLRYLNNVFMINTGIFPDKIKIAKIILILKKDDESQFTNYRPISLLPTISKIFERVIFKQLYKFLHDSKLLYDSQYGFREGHSIEYATLEIVDRITLEMDNMNTPISIFLDLSKAFDTLDHQILIKKLEYYGLNELSIKLMESYLSNSKQYVEIDDSVSDMLDLTTEVQQGSILGPLLFIIYMNDIAHASKMFYFIIYANNTTLSTIIEIVVRSTTYLTISEILKGIVYLNIIFSYMKDNKICNLDHNVY